MGVGGVSKIHEADLKSLHMLFYSFLHLKKSFSFTAFYWPHH